LVLVDFFDFFSMKLGIVARSTEKIDSVMGFAAELDVRVQMRMPRYLKWSVKASSRFEARVAVRRMLTRQQGRTFENTPHGRVSKFTAPGTMLGHAFETLCETQSIAHRPPIRTPSIDFLAMYGEDMIHAIAPF